MKYLLTLFLIILVACSVKTNDSEQKIVQSGASYTYVIVRLEFLQQIQQLCSDSLLPGDYASTELYKKAVADCTFDKISSLNLDLNAIGSFSNQYCQDGSDLSGYTQEQQDDILAACLALGF